MSNFFKLAQGVDVQPLLLQIHRNPDLWDQNRLRTTHPLTPHKEISDIWLRFNEVPPEGQEARIIDEHESVWYPAAHVLTEAIPIIHQVNARVKGERIGRCLITRLEPGRRIEPHVDGGSHADYYDRFHLCLQGSPGSIFRCGSEQVAMLPGEVWHFRNELEHEVVNNGSVDRIHLIVDLRCHYT